MGISIYYSLYYDYRRTFFEDEMWHCCEVKVLGIYFGTSDFGCRFLVPNPAEFLLNFENRMKRQNRPYFINDKKNNEFYNLSQYSESEMLDMPEYLQEIFKKKQKKIEFKDNEITNDSEDSIVKKEKKNQPK